MDLSKKNPIAFSMDGRRQEILPSPEKLKILDRFAQTLNEYPRNILDAIADHIPDKIPFFHHIFSDASNLFYVLTASVKYPHIRNVDIFSPQWRYLYRGQINLKPGSYWIRTEMRDNHLVVFIENRESEKILVNYSLKIPNLKK